MSNNVGLDAGCAYIKIAYKNNVGEIQQFSIPSLARYGKATVGMGNDAGFTYHCDGEEWSINPDHEKSADTRFDSYPYSSLNAVLSTHALIEAGFTDEVTVASGIPLNHYFEHHGGPNKSKIEDKHRNYDRQVKRAGHGSQAPLRVISKKVCPEALAAWVDVCLDDDGNDRESTARPVGLVDIGGRTTDITVALPGFRIDAEHTGTIELGYLDVCSHLNDLLIKHHDAGRISTFALDKALQTKEIQLYRGSKLDISELVEKAVSIVSNEIAREVERRFMKAGHLAGICYFGGGAENMRSQLSKSMNVHIPEKAQFANARGYLKALEYVG
ncbi:hypothetical protein GCM10023116_16120 [Kistimonas scapharcae]|uniref:Uncharacterized protein n=1 Tax=Kistimonas scapharcae TaxID=1036133 RepID=A0ABP8UZF1_9GAMM